MFSFRYFYRLLSGPEPLSTFEKDRAWHVPEELDLLAMQVDIVSSTISSRNAISVHLNMTCLPLSRQLVKFLLAIMILVPSGQPVVRFVLGAFIFFYLLS